MEVSRYIQIQAVKLHDNSLIPIWDERISFYNGEDCSDFVRVIGNYQDIHNVTNAVYDLETRTVLAGVEIDLYPDKTEFQKGDKALYETARYRHLKEATVVNIVFETYDMDISKGSELSWTGLKLESDVLYCVKQWKPYYILNDGTKITWEHKLYHKID